MKKGKVFSVVFLLIITIILIGGTTYIALTQIFKKDKVTINEELSNINISNEVIKEEKKEVKVIDFNYEDENIKIEVKNDENNKIELIINNIKNEQITFEEDITSFEVKSFNDYYLLISKKEENEDLTEKVLILQMDGVLLEMLPNLRLMPQDGVIYNKDCITSITTYEDKIVLEVENKNPELEKVYLTKYYYEINDNIVELASYENKYYKETTK